MEIKVTHAELKLLCYADRIQEIVAQQDFILGGDGMSTGDKRKQRDELSETDREQILRLNTEKQQLKERVI